MRLIPISEQLSNYIEMLCYEVNRYKDLLQVVDKESSQMTDEEWKSSWEYFSKLYEEAELSKHFALEEVYHIYEAEIGNESWQIDFDRYAIIIGEVIGELKLNKNRQEYGSYLYKLYPEKEPTPIRFNGPHVKDVTLQVTDACNMACTYCYQHNKGTHSMSFDTAKRFLSMILDADEMTNSYMNSATSMGITLNFIGGEPWLEVDLISKISDWFISELFRRKHPWAIKFMFGVCSNGLLHFKPEVQNYIKKHINHLTYSISIDGSKELHDSCRVDLAGNGTYDRAMAGVFDYRNNLNGDIGSKMTISPNNVDKIFEAVTYMVETNGYDAVNFNCVYEDGWTNEHATILYQQLHKVTDWLIEKGLEKKIQLSIFSTDCGKPQGENDNNNWCGGNGLMVAVDYKGDIYPCIRYMESSIGDKVPPFIIGNLECGINRKQEHRDKVECLNCITRRSQSTDECFNCPISRLCGWCSGYNYEVFGTPNKRTTFICCMHKARTLANVYHWRRLGVDFPNNCPKEWAIPIIGEEEYEKLNSMEVAENGANISQPNN